MTVRNKKIKDYAKEKKVPLWRIAERYRGGITDSYFSRLLRKSFTDEEEKEILFIIDNISTSQDKEAQNGGEENVFKIHN